MKDERCHAGRGMLRPYKGSEDGHGDAVPLRGVGRIACVRAGFRFGEGAGGVDGAGAVDEQGLTRYVAGGFGGQEDYGAIEVMGLAGAFYGDAVGDVGDPFGVVVHDFVLVGAEPAGGEAVYGDAVFAPVVGEAHGELADAAAAGAIGAEAGESGDAGDRADADDASVIVFDHAARNSLRDEERASQIRIENQIPVVPGDVDGGFSHVTTRVVHEDVDLAESLARFSAEFLDAGLIADVQGE